MSVPPPLQIPPSRARRQFAMRLAQRKAELKTTRESEDDPDDVQESQEREVREGHERFKRLFEGMDSSDEEGEGGDDEGSPEREKEKSGKGDEEGVVV
ncbi:sporulation-induced protein [Paraconiothyrium brasiliense]|uniref:Sporulation-induced protein n=1 Tax=Paraconiothyrium brasiliense TaxID=300254 RepID=A0ABR3QR20_9PLEO